MTESAHVMVTRPLAVIESHLWTVTNWASCLHDVVSVRRATHERYHVQLAAGRRVREALVAVRWNARHHRFAWKTLDGPPWSGQLQLSAVNGRRTRVALELTPVPTTPLAALGALAELMVGGRRRRDASQDLRRIAELIMSLPEPARLVDRPRVAATSRDTLSLEAALR